MAQDFLLPLLPPAMRAVSMQKNHGGRGDLPHSGMVTE